MYWCLNEGHSCKQLSKFDFPYRLLEKLIVEVLSEWHSITSKQNNARKRKIIREWVFLLHSLVILFSTELTAWFLLMGERGCSTFPLTQQRSPSLDRTNTIGTRFPSRSIFFCLDWLSTVECAHAMNVLFVNVILQRRRRKPIEQSEQSIFIILLIHRTVY